MGYEVFMNKRSQMKKRGDRLSLTAKLHGTTPGRLPGEEGVTFDR